MDKVSLDISHAVFYKWKSLKFSNNIIMFYMKWFFFKLLFERQGGTEAADVLSAGSFPECLHQPRLVQAAAAENSAWISCMDFTNPLIGPVLELSLRIPVSRKLEWITDPGLESRHWDIGYGCPKLGSPRGAQRPPSPPLASCISTVHVGTVLCASFLKESLLMFVKSPCMFRLTKWAPVF